MRPRNCAGSGGLVAEVFQDMPHEAVEQLRASFENLLNDRRADWPSSWCQCRAVLLPQKARWDSFAQLRTIMLLSISQKLFARVLLRLTSPWATPRECWTFGFRRGLQPSEMTRTLTSIVAHCREWSIRGHIVKTDLPKAYDSESIQYIAQALYEGGTPPALVKTYLRMCLERKVTSMAPGIRRPCPSP